MIVDFHSHVLPNIDDGSKDLEMSLEMLKLIAKSGVDVQILTPHFYAHKNSFNSYNQKRNLSYQSLIKELDSIEFKFPKIYLGAEVAYFSGISKASILDQLTINNSKVLLLEMPFYKWDDSILNEVRDLIERRNYTIIIAHLERYFDLGFSTKKYINKLLEMPVYIQINAESLNNKRVLKMLKKGQAHILGSDCHNLQNRKPNLALGRKIVADKLGDDQLSKIDIISTKILKEIDSEF